MLGKKKKKHAYEIYEGKRGEQKIRNVSSKKLSTGEYDMSEVFFSKKTPSERRLAEQLYNQGFIGLSTKTGAEEYAQTVE
jgi:hypothetical protein